MLERDHFRLENVGLDHFAVEVSVSLFNDLSTLKSRIFQSSDDKYSNDRELLSFKCFHFCGVSRKDKKADKLLVINVQFLKVPYYERSKKIF